MLKVEDAQDRLSLHMSKCHIVGNHMSRLKCGASGESLTRDPSIPSPTL